tara:strand:- start:275 stop:736 length:462 start_codon:yes stop_codon:yes gene_type:complete
VKIILSKISNEKTFIEGSESSEFLKWNLDQFLKFRGNIRYRFSLKNLHKKLVVQGELSLPINIQCSRCTEFFSTSILVSDFLRDYSISDEIFEIDITSDINEALILHLPAFPVCGNDCLGICSKCGVNLNKVECNCNEETGLSQWSVLDKLDF